MEGHNFSARTADDVRMALPCSHANDDPEDTDFHVTANDGMTDYENDELSNSGEDMIASVSSSNNQLTESSARLLAVSQRQGELADGDNSPSVPFGQNQANNSRSRRTAEFASVDNVTRRAPVDGNHNRDGLSLHMPSEGGVSPSEVFDDERDPNYATQRPDTLGAINVAAAATANAFAGPTSRPVYQVSAAARVWTMTSTVDDISDERTEHLGRRTCGAGMDQLELNQRHLMNADIDAEAGDGDGSDEDDEEDDDTGLGSVNQCESTEADQYKMDPEADQTAGVVGAEVQENAAVIADSVRPGARGCILGQRRRTDGAVSDVSPDMDDPEEDQATRAVSAENTASDHAALVSLPIVAANAVGDEQQLGAIERHPQSAFSVPKPRVTKSKPGESESSTYSDRPVPSIRHSKSNTDVVFKPIGTGLATSDSATHRSSVTSKSADGSNIAGIVHGELSQHAVEKKQLLERDSGTSSQGKQDADGRGESDRHRSSKQAHDVNSSSDGRSRWVREPLWTDVPVSLPSACHLPGEGGAIAVGTFAPANSSSQQATPEKTGMRLFDDSADMSPIQPMSSSSSRPLSVNGLHAVDSASVNYLFPSMEFSTGIQGPLPQYSHKVLCLFFSAQFFLEYYCHWKSTSESN